MRSRRRFRVLGIVQGVGFRPFVARLANSLSLSGFVQNSTGAVIIEVEGPLLSLNDFATRLESEAPPASTIEHITTESLSPNNDSHFTIAASIATDSFSVGLPPDLAICADCLRELNDPQDRRYRYPFLNCTNCGPRYTIVTGLPYDRPLTTMQSFPLCDACHAEYKDPANRRYHAQPIACPVCGPQLQMPLDEIELRLLAAEIAAIRGLGGFHLACNARNAMAVQLLRQRKARGDQPFALMVKDLSTARQLVSIDDQSAALLQSSAAPIVLLPKLGDTQVGNSLAPHNGYLGVMLPYTPLHHLLFQGQLDSLVMTSGNRHGEPISTTNQQAQHRLALLADFFVLHNREIIAACDDSVVRLYRGRPLAIRRARGYAPLQLELPIDSPPTLAVGADLKAALGLAQGRRAYISPHIGDMENLETLEAFEHTLHHLHSLYHLKPARIVHDAHPGYLSTQWAKRQGLPIIPIQHHRAHVASVMSEYAIAPDTPVLAAIFDGTGYGDDGAIWGGEFFSGTLTNLVRAAHLPYVALPGGDASAKRPSLAAIAHLHAANIDWQNTPAAASLNAADLQLLTQQLTKNIHCHPSSSMGRLFDAAASLLNIRHQVAFEAQAAIELEALAAQHNSTESYSAKSWHLAELWQELLFDPSTVQARARRFTYTIATWTTATLQQLAGESGTTTIILSGGVFQNILLLESITASLESHGLTVRVPRYLPPNDGGIALGQLYLGALQSP